MKKVAVVIVFTILCATLVLLLSESFHLPPPPGSPLFEHDYEEKCAKQIAETADVCPQCPAPTSFDGTFDSIFAAAQNLWRYENPIMNKNRARTNAAKFAKIPDKAINFRDDDQKQFLNEILKAFIDERVASLNTYPFIDNFMYGPVDDTLLYSITRWTKPSKVIEIGSGFSTATLNRALQKNAVEGRPGEHICIEPYRAGEIHVDGDITIIEKPLEEVELEIFSTLSSGDILFIDSSHVVVPYSDVILEYAFILPILAKGVIVHIHDIFLPFDYTAVWMFQENPPRPYDEQWMLAALLSGGNNWEILFSTFYMKQTYPDMFLDLNFPYSAVGIHSDSFWMNQSQIINPKEEDGNSTKRTHDTRYNLSILKKAKIQLNFPFILNFINWSELLLLPVLFLALSASLQSLI